MQNLKEQVLIHQSLLKRLVELDIVKLDIVKLEPTVYYKLDKENNGIDTIGLVKTILYD